MRIILSMLLSAAVSASAFAQGTNCAAAAAEKKLSGNARAEFILQCEKAGKARMTLATKETKKSGMASAGKDDHCGHSASDM